MWKEAGGEREGRKEGKREREWEHQISYFSQLRQQNLRQEGHDLKRDLADTYRNSPRPQPKS